MATINHKKYDEATETFKDFNVYDGKETLIFKVDGSEGNVGIGTESPNSQLSLYATTTAYMNFRNATNISSTYGLIIEATNNESEIWNYANGYMRFGTNNSERMRITSAGYVGIGTTSPVTILTAEDTNANIAVFNVIGTSPNYIFDVRDDGTSVFRVAGTGNVGIGTSAPSDKLEVAGNIRANVSNGGGFMLTGSSASGLVRNSGSGIALRTSTTDRLVVDASGNIGIGTNSPTYKVDIYSNTNIPLRIHRPNNANLDILGAFGIGFSTRADATTSTTDTRSGLFSYYNGNLFLAAANTSIDADPRSYARLTILNDGNVGIGTDSPSQKLSVKAGNANQLSLDNAGERFTQISFLNNAAQKAAIWLDETVDEFAIYAAAGYTTPIYANGVERVRVTNNGLTFNGDTAAANALDDYEEGTWTPTYAGSGGGSAIHTIQSGTYTKIGNVVTCSFRIVANKDTLSGDISLTGLPFTSSIVSGIALYAARRFATNFVAFGEVSGTSLLLYKNDSSSASTTSVTDADLQAVTSQNDLRGTFSYLV